MPTVPNQLDQDIPRNSDSQPSPSNLLMAAAVMKQNKDFGNYQSTNIEDRTKWGPLNYIWNDITDTFRSARLQGERVNQQREMSKNPKTTDQMAIEAGYNNIEGAADRAPGETDIGKLTKHMEDIQAQIDKWEEIWGSDGKVPLPKKRPK